LVEQIFGLPEFPEHVLECVFGEVLLLRNTQHPPQRGLIDSDVVDVRRAIVISTDE